MSSLLDSFGTLAGTGLSEDFISSEDSTLSATDLSGLFNTTDSQGLSIGVTTTDLFTFMSFDLMDSSISNSRVISPLVTAGLWVIASGTPTKSGTVPFTVGLQTEVIMGALTDDTGVVFTVLILDVAVTGELVLGILVVLLFDVDSDVST